MDDLPAAEIDRWARYWSEEPWGAYRDNMHAALIAVEILRPHMKEGEKLNISDFMFEHHEDRAERSRSKFLAELNAMAVRDEIRARRGSQ